MIEKVERWYGWIKHITIALDILFLVTLLINYFGYLPDFWNVLYIFYFVLAINTFLLALKINKIPEHEREHKSWIYLTGHLFILILIVIGVNQFLQREIINNFLPYIIGLAIAVGFLTFYTHQNRVEQELEDEKEKEEKAEKKRKDEFSIKFKAINKIPILRSIVKWMYKEGWIYSIGLILIVTLGFVLRINNLGLSSFWNDEIVIVYTAQNFILGKWFSLPSGEQYIYAIISTLLTSISIITFGLSEFSARLPFALIGGLTSIANYKFVKRLFSKNIAILSSLAIATSLWLINYSREVRMYALNIMILYVVAYFLYNYIKSGKLKDIILVFGATLIGVINHTYMLIIIPLLFFFVYLGWKRGTVKNGKWFFLLLTFLLIFSFLFLILYWKTIFYFIFNEASYSFWVHGKLFYYDLFITKFPYITIIFISSFLSKLFTKKNSKDYVIFFIPIITFLIISFIIDAKLERYSIVIYPLILITAIFYVYYLIKNLIKLPKATFIFVFIITLFILSPIYDGYMVSQNKISYDQTLQKNKYSWKEGTLYLKSLLTDRDLVISSDGMLTRYYGVYSDYTVKRESSRTMINNNQRDYYTGLYFIQDINSFNGYLILDKTRLQEPEFRKLIADGKFIQVYNKEGIIIYKK